MQKKICQRIIKRMNRTFKRILELINLREVLVSVHGYEELENDDLTATELIAGARNGQVIEDYPDFHKGPAILVLQKDHKNSPVHVVWGIPKCKNRPAVLVTAYRPSLKLWAKDFRRRL
ncbi:MAG: DUF4258 domain-containing protein [Candidatus Rifleibacteriota bacterium]